MGDLSDNTQVPDSHPHRWVIPVLDETMADVEIIIHLINGKVWMIAPPACIIGPRARKMLCDALAQAETQVDELVMG